MKDAKGHGSDASRPLSPTEVAGYERRVAIASKIAHQRGIDKLKNYSLPSFNEGPIERFTRPSLSERFGAVLSANV